MRVTIIVVCFCISLLLPEILCGFKQDIAAALEKLEKMASKNKSINEILIPLTDGLVKSTTVDFTYKGILMAPYQPDKVVEIKFIHEVSESEARKEYKIYWYLGAMFKPTVDVEKYGIPTVFYFGIWKQFYLLAITSLDKSLASVTGKLHELDGLFICRDFVRTSKYIHGRGIRHDNIKAENIMFRGDNAFITDYKEAQRMGRNKAGKPWANQPISAHSWGLSSLKGDWKSFLNIMCMRFNQDLKNMRDTNGLEKIFYEFNKHVSDTQTPLLPYDYLYNLINVQIQSVVAFNKEGNWPESSTIFNISSISGPSEMRIPHYDSPYFSFFTKEYNLKQNFQRSGNPTLSFDIVEYPTE